MTSPSFPMPGEPSPRVTELGDVPEWREVSESCGHFAEEDRERSAGYCMPCGCSTVSRLGYCERCGAYRQQFDLSALGGRTW